MTDSASIVQQVQTLDDIEGDLIDTAIAVTESQPGEIMMQSAEAMESVLEQAIPSAPPDNAASTDGETAIIENIPSVPVANGAESDVPVDTAQAIEADLKEAVPPEDVSPPDHDIAMETEIEEATSPIQVDVEQPTAENIAEAAANPEDVPAIVHEEGQSNGPVAPQIDSSTVIPSAASTTAEPAPIRTTFDPSVPGGLLVTAQAEPSKPVVQTPYASAAGSKPVVPLPEGLTEASPSVIANTGLVQSWRADPKDVHSLLALFNWAVLKTEINDARAWYNAVAVDNPTAIQPLLALINLELALSNFPQVEALFGKALKGVSGGITAAADVSVWKAYLHYIRRQNPISEGAANVEQVRGIITQAYEYALKECGVDRDSGEIWQEYVSFVGEPSPKNTWETQQQMDNLRKIYQRAVCIPLNNVEALWKAYDAFESGLNKLTAKKFLAERSPAYMTARTALRELRSLTDALPNPILPPHPTFTDQDRSVVIAWKAYLKWEEGNPLVIEDQAVLNSRVGYALRKCLGQMRHFPELWHYAANYHMKSNDNEEASSLLKAAVQACPKSLLLTFSLADLEEERKKFSNCHTIYDTLLTKLQADVDQLKLDVAVEVDVARGPEIPPQPADGDTDMNMETTRLIEEREARGKLVAERRARDVDDLATAGSIVWIMYMRFARRAEGIKAARAVFGKARKSPHVTWHTFEASAMMEYHANKDASVAIRIFELGFKLFSEDVDYVVRYLQFLLNINDDTNARALFERSAVKIPAEKSRQLWDAWARYEYMYGDLAAVQKLETRFSEVFPNDSPLKRFAQRFTYHGIDQIALRDLGFGLRSRQPPPPVQSLPPRPISPAKRPAPDSPRDRRSSIDRDRERSRSPGPGYKRYRQASPPPPRRYPLPERERDRGPRYNNGPPPRDRSPLPIPLPPMPRRDDRGPMPTPPPVMPPPPAVVSQYDRSGVAKPLAWFISTLPPARAFDGPIFRPDDIMHLFGSINPQGVGMGIPPQPAARAPYPERSPYPDRGGYSDRPAYPEPPRGYGGPPSSMPPRRY